MFFQSHKATGDEDVSPRRPVRQKRSRPIRFKPNWVARCASDSVFSGVVISAVGDVRDQLWTLSGRRRDKARLSQKHVRLEAFRLAN